MSKRKELLLKMYDQLWNNINRQISIVWQSLSGVVGSITLLVLGSNEVLDFDLAITLIVMLCAWLMGHVYDSSLWCNRNLAIISNIERTLLCKKDIEEIHYFFENTKEKGMIEHLRLQWMLGLGLSISIILYHFYIRVFPGLESSIEYFQPLRSLPYLFLLLMVICLFFWRNSCIKKYRKFIQKSPGPEIN